ncbi:MAG: hypothetical protein AAGB13_03400 [Cyanobacteria bacterium P01_F01_bin.33]
MKTYFTDPDRDVRIIQAGSICDRLHRRVQAAQGNPELLAQLVREAATANCKLPESTEEGTATHSQQDTNPQIQH